MTGSDLKEHLELLTCQETAPDCWAFQPLCRIWGKAEADRRLAIFSQQGTGSRGVLLSLRSGVGAEAQGIRLRGQFLLPVERTPQGAGPGFDTLRTAVVEPVTIRARPAAQKDRDILNRPILREQPPFTFPGVLAERFPRNEDETLHRSVSAVRVLWVPRPVPALRPGDLAELDQVPWTVRTVQELYPDHREYLIQREEDV